jgi:YVTN family beta-propeller protein
VSDVNGRQVARYGHNDQALDFQGNDGNLVEIPVRNGPISGIAVSPDGRRLMVTHYGHNSVSVIHTGSHRVVQTVDGVNEPYAIVVDNQDAGRAYVSTASPAYDSIAAIDTSSYTVVATYPLALSISDIAVSSDGRYVYAGRNDVRAADVAVLDTETDKVEVIDIADAPGTSTQCVRVSPDGSRLYVGTNGPAGGRLVVTGTRVDDGRAIGHSRWRQRKNAKSSEKGLRVIDTVEIGLPIRDVALSPDGTAAYVASCGSDAGAVLDVLDTRTNKITGTRKVAEIAGLLTGLTISGDGDRAYLVSDEGITVLCTLTHDVIGTVRVATQPSCLVESPDGNYLYIAGYDGTVTVAPVASTMTSIEAVAHDGEWAMPELMQYEAALV